MADRFEVMVLRHEQRIRELEAKLRELTEGGPAAEWGSKQRPSDGIYLRDRSARGRVGRVSFDSSATDVKVEEV